MTLTKNILLLSICLSGLSCNWRAKNEENNLSKKVHLIDLVKSYEPEKYAGKVPKEFYTNRGFYDWWRFPLVYPYSIGCVDVKDYGSLYSDEGKTDFNKGESIQPLTDYFDEFIFDGNYFVAKKCKTPFDSDTLKIIDQYFIFSFSNGVIKSISGKENLKTELKEKKFSGDITFITIREYADRL